MGVYRILGDKVLSRAEYARLLANDGGAALESVQSPGNHPLESEFVALESLVATPGGTAFVPIGQGKPLTILIREVYTGRHPKTGGLLGSGGKSMAVVTGLKDYSVFAATSRALNFLQKDVKPHTRIKAPSTFENGTNVVAYSPAVVTDSFNFTVEMAFDRFNDGLLKVIADGLSAAAGIPLLLPAAGYLLAASGLVKTGSALADGLIDGKAAFSKTDVLAFNVPGESAPVAEFRALCDFDANGWTYDPGRGLIQKDGNVYKGEDPYVIISLDGAPRRNLESFTPTLASAGVLKQFFDMRDGATVGVTAILDAVKLANDMKFRLEAEDLQKQLADAAAADKPALQARIDALKKNILSDALKLK